MKMHMYACQVEFWRPTGVGTASFCKKRERVTLEDTMHTSWAEPTPVEKTLVYNAAGEVAQDTVLSLKK